ncbi:MAG: prolipoprotein diacylglyceryl transferase [Bacteroidetes bacterium]|nr:prolipoprotein diacylglyceryl transferase [Bacteroidota bacterium]
MYAGLSDFFNDIFGTHFAYSFPPTFGFLVAISFLLAAWTLGLELKRKKELGYFAPTIRKTVIGEPASKADMFWNGVFGFIVGSKLVYAITDSSTFFENPQEAILSLHGSLIGGLAFAAFFAYLKFREKQKEQLKEPKIVEENVYPHHLVSEFTMAAAIGGLIGAKIFHIFEYWSDFMADPFGMFFSGSGLTMYGGLIVGGASVLWYGKKYNVTPLQLCDAAAPGIMLAYGTGRLGCQIAGDGDWGIVNTLPKPGWMNFLPDWFWSYTYPHNVNNVGVPIPSCIGNHCYQLPEGVFPTPLYESIACILLFFLLWSMRKKITSPGVLFSVYLVFNGIERFLIESIRVNSQYHIGGIAFTQAQLISVLLFITGITGILLLRNRSPKIQQV